MKGIEASWRHLISLPRSIIAIIVAEFLFLIENNKVFKN